MANGIPVGRSALGLYEFLRNRLLAGRITNGQFLPTERELAATHGIAQGTVRRALRKLAEEGLVESVPRRGHRVLARVNDPDQGCPVTYFLSTDGVDGQIEPFYQQLGREIEAAVRESQWSFMGMTGNKDHVDELFQRLEAVRSWGLILDSANPVVLDRARRSRLPVVVVDHWNADADFDSVIQDNFAGGERAARHLVDRGFKKIAWFGPIRQSCHGRERFGGASVKLNSMGMKFSQCVEVGITDPDRVARARKLLSRKDRPDAVLALWRPVLRAVVDACRELGLTIGKDIEVVGWCSEEVYDSAYVPIFNGDRVPPTVVWRSRAMAETAVSRLVERRRKPELPVMRMSIPTRLRTS